MATKYASDTAARKELENALTILPDRYIACRDVRHAWSVENDFHVYRQAQEKGRRTMHIARDLVCMRCGTLRHEVYIATKDRGLEKIAQSYDYPEKYAIPGVPRGVKPSAIIQQEAYRRAMEKVAGAARSDRERGD